jgi:hypothetical protein
MHWIFDLRALMASSIQPRCSASYQSWCHHDKTI